MAGERLARILVVEDDPTIRAVLAEVLEDAGYAMTIAIHGVEALARIRDCAPDLVLSDIMMPVMDGLELCRQITHASQIPVILMSSAPPPDAAACGAVLVLPKPFDLDTLEAVVARVLQRGPRVNA